MLNPKQITRKKSQNLITLKEAPQIEIKRKKSVSNLAVSTKSKKQTQRQANDKKKTKQEKKLTHSQSKGKISKRHIKSEKNDENVNSMNHKRSVQKLQTIKISKQMRPKGSSDQMFCYKKEQKKRHINTENTLTKTNSQAKLKTKRQIIKKLQLKEHLQNKHESHNFKKNYQKLQGSERLLSKKPSMIKLIPKKSVQIKNKPKKFLSTINQQKSIKQKPLKNRISEIIQKSILYSDVNYEFQEQISLLGSGIKKEQIFYLPYPFNSVKSQEFDNKQQFQRRMLQNNAAKIIQKNFRGYIQRKYIEQARYIIDCIKKIQRFWRLGLSRKRKTMRNQPKALEPFKNEISTSLLTVKDLNDTGKIEKKTFAQPEQYQDKAALISELSRQNIKDKNLKDIIKNILSEDTLNQKIKEKIRNAISSQNELNKNFQRQKNMQKLFKNQQNGENYSLKSQKPQQYSSSLDLSFDQQSQSKDFYVKNKINMEIYSEKYFNSPMNTSNQYLTSPGGRKLTSPMCLSSSNSKDVKSSYNNYFKSARNGNPIFTSPQRARQENHKMGESHSCQKGQKQNNQNAQNRQNIAKVQENQNKYPHRLDYLLNCEIGSNSPINLCKQTEVEDINLLSTQKFQQPETRRALRAPIIKPFPTAYCFIEQFCLIITDYLRQDQQTIQTFLQKIKGLKFFKIQKLFKEWQRVKFEEYGDNNQQLQSMLIKENCVRPVILSRSEKKMIMEYQNLRLFLNENDFSETDIFAQKSPQNSFLAFIFDVFEESIYKQFSHFSMKNLHLASLRQNKTDSDYLSNILSNAMANMLKSAQMLCGSFETLDMTQYQKNEKYLINEQRIDEMVKQLEPFDKSSCEMWIKMLISKQILDQLIVETAYSLKY